MSQNSKISNLENQPNVGEAVSKTELFFKKNQNVIVYSLIALVVIAGIILAVKYFYTDPLKKEAVNQTFTAEQLFRAENYEQALNGDGNSLGFAQIIDEYGSKAGKVVYLYAGICELELKNAENAVNYLNKFSTKDPLLQGRALCLKGDAYVALEKYQQAYDSYMKAAGLAENSYSASYLLKAALVAEEMGNNAQALKCYEEIKAKYPNTMEGTQIDKYISRIKIAE